MINGLGICIISRFVTATDGSIKGTEVNAFSLSNNMPICFCDEGVVTDLSIHF